MAFEIFDNLIPKTPAAIPPDLYVQDLEKVKFTIDGVQKEFVGGSYGGASFFVEVYQFKTGRRLVVDELPNADVNTIQDLGRKTRGNSFKGYLLGSDVFAQKIKLIDAAELGGEKELVHPYLGRFIARAGELTMGEESKTKQVVKFTLNFVIIDDKVTAKKLADRKKLIGSAVDSMNSSALDNFGKIFKAAGKAKSVVDAAQNSVDSAVDAVFAAKEAVRSVALFTEQVKNIKTNIAFLLGSPALLGQALLDLVTFEDTDNTDRDYRREQEDAIAAASFTSSTENTHGRSQSDDQITSNDSAINDLIKNGASGSAALAVPNIVFDSVQDASNNIDTLSNMFDDAQLNAASPDTYYGNLSTQTQTTEYIAEISENLDSVETIELHYSTTVLTLDYELHGSLDGFADIIKRNAIKDPFFLPANTPLEVLTGGD